MASNRVQVEVPRGKVSLQNPFRRTDTYVAPVKDDSVARALGELSDSLNRKQQREKIAQDRVDDEWIRKQRILKQKADALQATKDSLAGESAGINLTRSTEQLWEEARQLHAEKPADYGSHHGAYESLILQRYNEGIAGYESNNAFLKSFGSAYIKAQAAGQKFADLAVVEETRQVAFQSIELAFEGVGPPRSRSEYDLFKDRLKDLPISEDLKDLVMLDVLENRLKQTGEVGLLKIFDERNKNGVALKDVPALRDKIEAITASTIAQRDRLDTKARQEAEQSRTDAIRRFEADSANLLMAGKYAELDDVLKRNAAYLTPSRLNAINSLKDTMRNLQVNGNVITNKAFFAQQLQAAYAGRLKEEDLANLAQTGKISHGDMASLVPIVMNKSVSLASGTIAGISSTNVKSMESMLKAQTGANVNPLLANKANARNRELITDTMIQWNLYQAANPELTPSDAQKWWEKASEKVMSKRVTADNIERIDIGNVDFSNRANFDERMEFGQLYSMFQSALLEGTRSQTFVNLKAKFDRWAQANPDLAEQFNEFAAEMEAQ